VQIRYKAPYHDQRERAYTCTRNTPEDVEKTRGFLDGLLTNRINVADIPLLLRIYEGTLN